MSTVGPIIFANETARTQLETEEYVVTFRANKRTTGDTWWRESRTGPKRGDCRVEFVDECDPRTPATLGCYVAHSGFESIEAWQEAIGGLNGEVPETGYLYAVTTREGQDDE